MSRWLFGKLPAHGDFVARGIAADARDRLDHWLAAEMERARARWGEDFDARYAAAPVWHFVDGDAASGWSGGILCASMDRVGRLFPLIVADPASDCAAAVAASGGCLALTGQAFAEGWTADQLMAAPLIAESLPWQPSGAGWALVGEDGPVAECGGPRPEGVIERMLEMAA